jgi:hypothetical protein
LRSSFRARFAPSRHHDPADVSVASPRWSDQSQKAKMNLRS